MPIYLKHCSQICLICVSEHFSFAEIIHPPHRCGISRCWLDSMVIAQVCLRLVTIKGHSKIYSFITQHNATDVASYEGACNWHADWRNVHHSCCRELNVHFSTISRLQICFREFGSTSNRPDNRRPRVFSFFCLLSILPNCCGNFFHTNIITE